MATEPPDGATARRTSQLLHVMFAMSGAAALIYQVVWLRGFALLLGSTLRAMSCVLAVWMVGMAGGSAAGGVLARRGGAGRSLRTYAVLEWLAAVWAIVVTRLLFDSHSGLLEFVARAASHGLAREIVAACALCAAVLLVPTACMGATLPLASVAVRDEAETASVYGVNTYGAAVGALVGSFVLIYRFGCVRAAMISAAIAALAGAIAWVLARTIERTKPVATSVPANEEPPANIDRLEQPGAVLALAFVSGFAFLSCELAWDRYLALILGNRVYVQSITLALVLASLGVGARLASEAVRHGTASQLLVRACAVGAVSLGIALWIQPHALTTASIVRIVLLVALVPVPATAMAVALPLALASAVSARTRSTHVAKAYALNTTGSFVGLLLTGWLLVPAVGSQGIVLGAAFVMIATAAVFARSTRSRWIAMAGVLPWTLTVAARHDAHPSRIPRERTVLVEEDAHAVFVLARDSHGWLRANANGTDLVYAFGSPDTRFVQESQAHMPLLLAHRVNRVLVLGSGYGITAGVAGSYPQVGHVDAVEIIPAMVRHARLFASGNYGYDHNARVAVHIADGRHFLALEREPYDVISANVSDPYLPGSSSFFTREFYELVHAHLASDGVFCQHVFGPDRAMLANGVRAQFRFVRALPSYSNGLSIIASDAPLDGFALDRFDDPTVHALLEGIGLGNRARIEQLLAMGDATMAALANSAPPVINSDEFPVLEYRRSADVPTFWSNF